MGSKIFVSYKFHDNQVQCPTWDFTSGKQYRYGAQFLGHIQRLGNGRITVRDYVDRFEQILDNSDHIYKGEHRGENLTGYSDDYIWTKLKDQIFDSSVTVVFISPGMREKHLSDRDQWIPWEISYSLSETNRQTESGKPVSSLTNGIVVVVLPDVNSSYSYFLSYDRNGRKVFKPGVAFGIIERNIDNFKSYDTIKDYQNYRPFLYFSNPNAEGYFVVARWDEFISNYNHFIGKALENRDNINLFDVSKMI